MPIESVHVRMLVLGFAVGCNNPVGSWTEVPTSSTIVSNGEDVIYAVNVDEGSVSRLVPATGDIDTLALGIEPTRITRGLEQIYVTLRGQREVVSVVDGANGLEVRTRATVGAEPYGIVTDGAGGPVYVALSLENRVVELDPDTLEELRSWSVPDEPRWLALDPARGDVYVASHRNGTMTRIDLSSGSVLPLRIPRTHRSFDLSAGTTSSSSEKPTFLQARLTGDPCVTSDGSWLAVPALYVDTVAIIPDDASDLEEGSSSGYGGGGVDVARMNPSLVLFELDEDEDEGQEVIPVFTVGDDGHGARRTSITSATCVPGDHRILASMESADTVLVVDTASFTHAHDDRNDSPSNPRWLGFEMRPTTDIATGRGPRGLTFLSGEPYVHTWLERRVSTFPWDDALEVNAFAAEDTAPEQYPVLRAEQGTELVASVLGADEQAGRDLFTTALDRRMTVHNGGVSCSTCHVDGREDGLSWPFADGMRQTLSLAGGAADTGPFTWNGSVASIGDEALRTTTIRMGGQGLNAGEQRQLEAWVATFRTPDTADRGRDDAVVARGRTLFESVEVGCASCHAGLTLTDGQNHAVHGTRATNTPSLRGIAATAPYRHDGSLETLRDVLDWAKTGAMGDTSSLDEADLEALETYLRTL